MFVAFKERYRAALEESRQIKDPSLKERRQYPVRAMVVFQSIIFAAAAFTTGDWTMGAGLLFTLGQGEFLESPYAVDMSNRVALNFLLSPAFFTIDNGVREPINVALSGRSFATNLGDGHKSVRDCWETALWGFYGRPGASVVPLSLVFAQLGQRDLADRGNLPWQQQNFFLDLIELLRTTDNSAVAPSDAWTSFTNMYSWRPSLLTLKSRIYIARGDERAFVVDSDAFRSLVGSALQAIFLPAKMSERELLFSEPVNPARNKNVLDKTMKVYPGQTLGLAISDTSSFTSSGVNLWIALLALLTGITTNSRLKHFCEPFVVRIKGFLLETTLPWLIQVYLFRTVGVSCFDESMGDSFINQGGYLGVAANMTMCLLAQSILLQSVRFQLLRLVRFIDIQSGGDDIFTALAGLETSVLEGLMLCKSEYTQYLGRQKDFVCYYIGENFPDCDYMNTGLVFCKKAVLVRVTTLLNLSREVKIISAFNIPVLEALFTPKPRSASAQRRELLSFVASALEATRLLFEPMRVYALLIALYIQLKDVNFSTTPFTASLKFSNWPGVGVVREAGYLFTVQALRSVYSVLGVKGMGHIYNATIAGKVAQSLSMSAIMRCEIVGEGLVFCTKKELRRLSPCVIIERLLPITVVGDTEMAELKSLFD